MNRGEIQSVLRSTGLNLWTLIDSAISIASSDHHSELRSRRDGIVERLYAPISNQDPITCNNNINSNAKLINNVIREEKGSSSPMEKVFGSSPLTPQSNCRVDVEDDYDVHIDDNDLIDQERKILAVKDCLEDPDQSDDDVVGLLQSLEDMDITFKALSDTDIGRHVNVLRKHPLNEVRRLVKKLVRKWKEIVDDWVKNNPDNASPVNNTDDEYSSQQILSKHTRNGNHVPDFACSPDLNNGRMSSNRNSIESNSKSAPIRETPLKSILSTPTSATLSKLKGQESLIDDQRLANAKKRLAENYQEAQNAKTQRKIQVMDIHEIPKPKNSFISRNKGGGHHNPHQSKRW